MDIRYELYDHMVECAPDRAMFNDVQKPYIIEYMQRYADYCERERVNGGETGEKALHKQNVNRSVLRKFLVGENVKCTFYNSGNKFWSELLDKHTIIEGIRDDGKTGISELQLGGEWFYENDFVRA